jgi:hypothetical protein
MEGSMSSQGIRGIQANSEAFGYSPREARRLAIAGKLPGVHKDNGVWAIENNLVSYDCFVVTDKADIYPLPKGCTGVHLEPVPGPVSAPVYIRMGGGNRHIEITSPVSGSAVRHHFLLEDGTTTTRYIIEPDDYFE